MTRVTSDILNDNDRVSSSFARQRKFHIHRTRAWQESTGLSRYSLCGVQIGSAQREVSVSSVKQSKYRYPFCKTCLKLKANGAT